MLPVCPRCNRHTHVRQHTEHAPNKRQKWLISTCSSCGWNFDIERVKGAIDDPIVEEA